MQNRAELAQRVADHGKVAEAVGWEWAARMSAAATRAEAGEVADFADVVGRALAASGEWALVELADAGPALGGLGANDVEALVRMIDERLSTRSPVAA